RGMPTGGQELELFAVVARGTRTLSRLLRGLKGLAGSVRSVQCHSSLPLVASCGLDRFLRVHNVIDSKLLHKVYLKSRLNCLLFTSRDNWEQEDMEPGVDASVKKEEEEVDEIWGSMVTVGGWARSKRKVEQPQRVGRRKKAAQGSPEV
ncbi:WD repeat-containing protein 74-like, partial [Hypanus sabinus]|uniref:WD repeat-containing protein 74-like n=1 Tax=Hypanus sabinus TaxID=79690 RepID=UPI0028C504C0